MRSTHTSIHLGDPIYLTIGKEVLASTVTVKTDPATLPLVSFHLPYECSEKLRRAVAAFNKEMGFPYYQDLSDDEELEAAE